MNQEQKINRKESTKSEVSTPSSEYLMSPLDIRLRAMSMSYCMTPTHDSSSVSKANSPMPKDLTPRYSVSDLPSSYQAHITFLPDNDRNHHDDIKPHSEMEYSDYDRKLSLSSDYDRKYSLNFIDPEKPEEPEHKLSISLDDMVRDDDEFARNKERCFLAEGTIKERFVREKSSFSRKRCIITRHSTYLPLVTIRHCRTGRIKQGVKLVKKFGIWTKDVKQSCVALKIMEKVSVEQAYSWDEDDVYKELRIMTELCKNQKHDNILYLHEVIETTQYIIAVLELVDGDLQQFLPMFKTEDSIRELFYQILQGYQFIVKNGYYHGDISPENILIKIIPNYNNTGKPKRIPKISDFGRSIEIDPSGPTIIDIDHVAGKPYYLAPEAYVNSYDAGPADIWALGITLYVLLYSYPPFEIANESDAIFVQFCKDGYDVIHNTERKVSEEALQLLQSMIVLEPEKRSTITEILQSDWFKNS